MPQCVILAGGLGTRLAMNGVHVPKLLIQINGQSLLSLIINELAREGYTDLLFCLGHESDQIIEEIKRIKTSVYIEYFVEKRRLGTLGALKQAREKLQDFFTVIMGDCFISNTNIGSIHTLAERLKIEALVLCKYTDHPADSDLIEINEDGLVLRLDRPPHEETLQSLNIGLAGISFFSKTLIESGPLETVQDISRHLLLERINSQNSVYALFHQGEIRDLGTVERIESFRSLFSEEDTISLSNKFVVLLDRDGTLNKRNGHISKYEEIEILESGKRIVDAATKQGLELFMVTNQPVVARGSASEKEVRDICTQLFKDMGVLTQNGCIYICPHYPESGFQNEISSLKKICSCRKPNPGLFLQAAKEHGFKLTNATMLGDSLTDIYAALRVGAFAIHLHEDKIKTSCKFKGQLGALAVCVYKEDAHHLISKVDELL